MNVEGHSLAKLRRELEETQKDYIAFMEAYDHIRLRIVASNELEPPREPLMHQWSGTAAVCGALEMAIHMIERRREAYVSLIKQVEAGELPNLDPEPRPRLTLVQESP